MTTIVSNGYYLAADRSMTAQADPALRRIDPTTLEVMTVNTGDFLKLKLLDSRPILFKGCESLGRIEAFATSGDAYLNASMTEILSVVHVFETASWLSTLRRNGHHCILMVTENCFTIRTTIRDSAVVTDFHPPGNMVADGSGSTHCDLMSNYLLDDSVTTIEEFMALASCTDEGTSRDYSAYGVQEKLFYPNITPSKEHCINLAKGMWNKVGSEINVDNIY